MVDLAELEICFLAGTLGQGGAERQLFYILKTLRQHGANVRVLSLTAGEFWEEPIRRLGVPVIYVGASQSRLVRLLRILAELRKDRPDILQAQHFYVNLYTALAGRLLKVPNLGAVRNNAKKDLEDVGEFFGQFSLHLPTQLVANSQNAIRNIAQMSASTVDTVLLPNVVDIDEFTYSFSSSVSESIKILAIGRLVSQKRFDRFIAMIDKLPSKDRIDALIVGDGPEKAKLKKMASDLELYPGTVRFHESVPNVAPFYQQADIFVLTSDWEGTPNVILEAMASGIPVVATKVGGVPDIIQNAQNGFLVNSDDVNELVKVMNNLIENQSLRHEIGERGRSYVENHHALDLLPVFLSKLYTSVLC
jgi:glycosyltransferase involved in cell wall biosynthesis